MSEGHLVKIRHLLLQDYVELKQSMIRAYENWQDSYWKEDQIATLLERFAEGQLAVEVDGKVVGCALSIIVAYRKFGDDHTYAQITNHFKFDTHDSKGDVLYGVEVFIHPDYRGMRLGRRLYEARRELCENLNLRSIVAGGRIPNYTTFAKEMTPQKYIEKVAAKEIYDQVLTFQISNDFHVRKILTDYLPGDKESHDYATLLEWINIYYSASDAVINVPKRVVRLGLVQWQMRNQEDLEGLFGQMEFFVDALSDYKSDFILFPEFFNAPLMARYNALPEAKAIRKLADYTDAIREKCMEFSVSYNINIITGSMPKVENGNLYNIGYLCRRDGTYERYEKIHLTPSEVGAWGMQGGHKIETFDTDAGRIGILICYDIEFPELARLLALDGIDILFVPFQTDTQNGYTRVRQCAQARAIENECYVAITGSVGNLPKVDNMDIQYSQAAVLTPSDFSFPNTGIKAEATPNAEMTLIVDVDIELLRELHSHGSVRTMTDRRTDLYQLLRTKTKE